ncbi:MAG: L-aspartate oxidase [Fimbriimonadaceae bacterium]
MTVKRYDTLVVGSGIAGLTFALDASRYGSVAVLTKAIISEANTSYAQGGIAAAVGEADSWQLHEEDTLIAGDGLCNVEAVRFLVSQAPAAIEWLTSIGARFDAGSDNGLRLGLEGGHSRHRIVHHQDRTGWEVERAVIEAVRANPRIRVFEHTFATRLLVHEGRCLGVAAQLPEVGEWQFLGRATMLATGGCGRLYQHTTNPAVATGDGIALAANAGAAIENMEFMQFHPTTLYHPQIRSFLISEAVRGAGATLRNHLGERFMYDYDERLELAPRDVVARAIHREMQRLETWCVYLDATHLDREMLASHFPTIRQQLATVGIELHKVWVPVVPAQHYSCGGIATDLQGRTNVPGLYAAGEVASTGVHGANRLASNSLLEALVFAKAAAVAVEGEPELPDTTPHESPPSGYLLESDSVILRRALQRMMTQFLGIERTYSGMKEAETELAQIRESAREKSVGPFARHPAETANLIEVAHFVIRDALARDRNVGLHYNLDLV